MASIAIVTPASGSRVAGTVEVRARVSGGTTVSNVVIVIGPPEYGTLPAVARGGGEYTTSWDTTRKLVDGSTPTPCDALFWITARATVDGVQVTAPYVAVGTANHPVPSLPAGGWRSELAWAAKYDGSKEQWKSGHSAVIGLAYAWPEDDPTGRGRRVMKVSVPDSARYDADQPSSTTVRFQAASRRTIVEGDEFCVGFAFRPSTDFPTVYPANDPANPNGPSATGYIAIFQLYGPPYDQGSPLVLQANRSKASDPLDEFAIRGNELNPGDPWPLLAIPYRRGRWTDVVFRIRASRSIESGWIEMYLNQGASTTVQQVPFVNGLMRVPRVLLRADSEPFRTDMQIYRVAGRIDRVTAWHTGHRIARTVSEADPRSYREGWRF